MGQVGQIRKISSWEEISIGANNGKNYIFQEVTADEFETVIYSTNRVEELSELSGKTKSAIYSSIHDTKIKKHKRQKRRFISIKLEDD